MSLKKIPIFFTFDNNYVEPAAVAFYSLLDKAKENVFYEMYVLHSDIMEEKQKFLTDIVHKKGNANLTFVNTNGFLDEFWNNGSFNFKSSNSTFTVDTIVRCFGSKFFPQYEKIIYSDVDVIFTDDISALYEIDMSEKYLAGVKNPFSKYSRHELSHLKPEHYEILKDKYIAGGIWVMNLKKIRDDNLEEKMVEVINDKTIIKRWNDQDIVNIACGGKIGFIPLNYISYPYLIDLLQNPKFTSDYTREELYNSIINPKIIHFAASKPWNSDPKYSNLWWTYFYYLGLGKTKIFKEMPSKEKIKYKKYKKLFLSSLVVVVALICIIIFG
ncbi:MAG: glycosyltransferase family 8 protein [Bacteroidales bacterium]|nr:glycosyltransferase family 8 protein [Bacteroidales bacterium]